MRTLISIVLFLVVLTLVVALAGLIAPLLGPPLFYTLGFQQQQQPNSPSRWIVGVLLPVTTHPSSLSPSRWISSGLEMTLGPKKMAAAARAVARSAAVGR